MEREEIVSSVRQWGGIVSDAILDPSTKTFSIPSIKGLIGYKNTCNRAVVYGDPLCAPEDLEQLSRAFHDFAQKQGWKIIYLTASEEFKKLTKNDLCKTSIEYGHEIYQNPTSNRPVQKGEAARLLRKKVRHATTKGVSVHEYVTTDPVKEKAMEKVAADWLKSRKGTQLHIANVYLFSDRIGKRWFYAEKEGEIIGTAVLNRLEHKKGWLLNHLMHPKDAPSGTSELLVSHILDVLVKEDCDYITFGAATQPKLGQITGLGKFSSWLARAIYGLLWKQSSLSGPLKFWEKFEPQYQSSYLLFSDSKVGVKEIAAILKTMNISYKI